MTKQRYDELIKLLEKWRDESYDDSGQINIESLQIGNPDFPFGPIPHWKYFKDEYPQNPHKWIYITDGKVVDCTLAYSYVPRYENENPKTGFIAWAYIHIPEPPND